VLVRIDAHRFPLLCRNIAYPIRSQAGLAMVFSAMALRP